MRYNPATHHRQSIRLRGYDYRQAGAYFVTICTYGREPVFGDIIADVMHLNAYGAIVAEDWVWLAEQFTYIDLDAFIVMPNHLHGIMVISESADDMRMGAGTMQAEEGRQDGEGNSSIAPTGRHLPLGRVVGAFKTMSTKHVNEWRETPGVRLWQRNYYEHIIRDADDLRRIREYILTNPARWSDDSEYGAAPS